MSYTPTEWKSGDVVTSAKLNKLEQGVADATGGGGTLEVVAGTTTPNDVMQAFEAGKRIYTIYVPEDAPDVSVYIDLTQITITKTGGEPTGWGLDFMESSGEYVAAFYSEGLDTPFELD